jgi:hypothetical protein
MDVKDGNCCDHRHLFSSVQYDLPQQTAKQIIEWGNQKIPDNILYNEPEDTSYGRERCVHCTVFFGIHTDKATPVIYLLENEPTFLIRFGRISCFSNEKFDVVKIEVYGDDLFRLHDKLGTCLNTTETFNAYRPHITIAYVQRGEGEKFVGDDTFDRLTARVETLCFSSKNGSRCRIRLIPESQIPIYAW